MDGETLTEVPVGLKRLVRYVVKGFYGREHAIVIDLLIIHPCVKEDDILELLKFDRKQLRAIINTLKTDKFLKARMRVETDNEGKMTRHNYYFINYSLFVNVVKYKLDHMRRKIETEQRDSANRSSYICPSCEKTFTDLEADQLLDPMSMLFLCTLCKSEVQEQVSDEPRTDSKSLMVKFNEQLEPLFALLKEVEDVKLSHSILEPEPTDIKAVTSRAAGNAHKATGAEAGGAWSGELSRNREYLMQQHEVTVTLGDAAAAEAAGAGDKRPVKERPVWMTDSTVEGATTSSIANNDENTMDSFGGAAEASTPAGGGKNSEDIMRTLLAHEKKSSAPRHVTGVAQSDDDGGGGGATSSSDEDDDPTAAILKQQPDFFVPTAASTAAASGGVGSMESGDDEDEDEDDPLIAVGGQQLPLSEVTQDIVAQMTPAEKENYIRISQQMYQDMYD